MYVRAAAVTMQRVVQVDIPNAVHAFQTAERICQAHPDKDWFQLTGLIHDIGKVLAFWGEPQVKTTAQ